MESNLPPDPSDPTPIIPGPTTPRRPIRSSIGIEPPHVRRRIGRRDTGYADLLFRLERPFSLELSLYLILLITGLAFTAALFLIHHHEKPRFEAIFQPALGIRTSLVQVDRDLDLIRLADRIEARIDSLADSTAALFFSEGIPRGAPAPYGALWVEDVWRAEDKWPANDRSERFIQHQGYNHKLVSPRGQYAIMLPETGTGGRFRAAPLPPNELRMRLDRVHALLERNQPVFPASPPDSNLLKRRGGSTEATWRPHTVVPGVADDSRRLKHEPIPLAAFLYCALQLDSVSTAIPDAKARGIDAGALEETLAARARSDLRRSARLDQAGRILPGRLADLEYPDSSWYRHLYAYVEHPASPLPRDFSPMRRPWFLRGWRASAPVWSAQYGDIGTELPVVTVATPIYDQQHMRVGVLAVDLRTEELARAAGNGRVFVLNYYFMLLSCLALLAIVYASGMWKYFRLLYYTFLILYTTYLTLAVKWLLNVQDPIAVAVFGHVKTITSMLSSILLIFAASVIFDELERRERVTPHFIRRTNAALLRYPGVSPFVTALTAAVAYWLVIWALGGLFKGREQSIGVWIDAVVSFLALGFFGFRCGYWMSGFQRWQWPGLLFGVFSVGYGVLQLFFPGTNPRQEVTLYAAALVAKMVFIVWIIMVVFAYVQKYNGIKRQLRKVVTKAFSLPLAQRLVVIGAKTDLREGVVLFVSEAGCQELALMRGLNPVGGTRMVPSVFGEDMFEPAYELALERLINARDLQSLAGELGQAMDDEGVSRLHDIQLGLCRSSGEERRIHFLSVVRWRDHYVPSTVPHYFLVLVGLRHEEQCT